MPFSAIAAEADPELSFHSTKEWALKKEGKSCALQTTFNNGFILRFDGGTSWVETMNIDFAQDVFTVDKSYDIKLSVPGVETLKTKSSAANVRALDISFRGRKDFFKALAQSSVLDLKIEKNNFRFYMTGFTKPAAEFEQCMSERALANPIVAETAKNYEINESIILEERTKEDTTAPTPELKSTLDKAPATAPVHDSKNRHAVAMEENSSPASDIPPSAPVVQPSSAPTSLAPGFVPKNAALSPEKLAAMAAEQTTQTHAPDAEVKSEDPAIKTEVQTPITPPAAIKEAKNIEPAPAVLPNRPMDMPPLPASEMPFKEQHSSPAAKINKESFRAKADFRNEGLPQDGQNLSIADKARLAELENMVKKLKAENIALNEEVKTTVNASEEERMSIASDNWNLEQATMRFNEAERQIKRLGQELQQERAKCIAEKNDLEASLFDPQITGQEQLARLASLEQELEQVKRENEMLRQGQSKAPATAKRP